MAFESLLRSQLPTVSAESSRACKPYYAATYDHKRDALPDGTMLETKSSACEQETLGTVPIFCKDEPEQEAGFPVILPMIRN